MRSLLLLLALNLLLVSSFSSSCTVQSSPVLSREHQNSMEGSAGGILVGTNSDLFNMAVGEVLNFSVSTMLTCKRTGFSWKFIAVYGPGYEEHKHDFLDELESVMISWQGPILIRGDFNLVRFISDKSNGVINHRWEDSFNNLIDKWGLIELSANNKKFTWTNNQDSPIFAKIDRIFVTTEWESAFPLSSVKALERLPSDHNPLVLNTGDNVSFGKKRFRFEKWWLEKDSFRAIVEKAWNTPCALIKSIVRWQYKVRNMRRMVRGWPLPSINQRLPLWRSLASWTAWLKLEN
jgi:hypothetical protein